MNWATWNCVAHLCICFILFNILYFDKYMYYEIFKSLWNKLIKEMIYIKIILIDF